MSIVCDLFPEEERQSGFCRVYFG